MGAEASIGRDVSTERTRSRYGRWLGGGIAGLAGGVAMGIVLTILDPAALSTAIPALYGQQGAVAGWIAHLFHSVVLGLVFVALVSLPRLRNYADTRRGSTALGAGYGVVLWVVTGSILLPLWLQTVGFTGGPPVPTFAIPSLVWHLAYGIVLGAVYPLARSM